jgi:hypothetical protein
LEAETKEQKYTLMMENKATIRVNELYGDAPRAFADYGPCPGFEI